MVFRPRPHQLWKLDASTYKRHEVPPRSIAKDVQEVLGHFEIIKEIFYSMPIDQAHEQHNGILQGLGGIIGIARPEVARCLDNFEDDFYSVIHNRN